MNRDDSMRHRINEMEKDALGDNCAPSLGSGDGPEESSSSPAADTGKKWWMSEQVTISIASINLLLAVASVAANSIVLILFCASKSIRKPQNIFTFNLALSDLLASVFTGVMMVSTFRTAQPETDPVMCVTVAVVLTSSCTCAICSIANIALVRYISIVRTSLQARLCRWTIVVPFCIGCWVLNFIILIILVVGDQMRAVRKPVTKLCSFDFSRNRTYNEAATVLIGVQILIVASAYVSIYRFVQQSKARVKGYNGSSSTKEAEQTRNLRQEMRLVAPMLAIFLCFCGSWISYIIVDIFVDPTELEHPWSHVLTQFILLLNMIANPVTCIAFNQVYREELKRLICTKRCKGHRRQQEVATRGGPVKDIRALETIPSGYTPSPVPIGAVEVVS